MLPLDAGSCRLPDATAQRAGKRGRPAGYKAPRKVKEPYPPSRASRIAQPCL